MEHAATNIHYTLLLACVLVAFSLGAIFSGFLVSWYCRRSVVQQARRLGKDPEVPHTLSLRSLAKLNGLLDGQKKEDKHDVSIAKMYSSFIPNGSAEPHCYTPALPGLPLGDPELSLSQSLSQGDGDLSGLPTPLCTPKLPIRNLKALSQHERNQNCNNPADSSHNPEPCGSGSSLGFMAVVGNSMTKQGLPFSNQHGSLNHGAAHTSSTSLHLPDEMNNLKDVWAEGGGGPPHHHHSQQSLPQAGGGQSALDELLKHIHEVSASGTGGIKVLTSTSSSGAQRHNNHPYYNHNPHSQTSPHYYSHSHHHSNHHNNNSSNGVLHQQIPENNSAPYYSTSTLPRDAPTQNSSSCSSASSSSSSSDNPTSSTSIQSSNSSTALQQQAIPERPGRTNVSVTRHHSQRHLLIKMGRGVGGVPRQHSFNQQTPQQAHFLAGMNTNSSSNGPPGDSVAANISRNAPGGGERPRGPSACLTRQHSYSEGPHMQQAAIVRRTLSLKPEVPPKPLFLPNTATSSIAEAGNYKY
ncbi:hypothetical protein PBY51_004666 [Eleginops maclovinus]|uniref:Uncharacterized protein n=2 Tax=Eleginops maclovinus TaxID=56733 RepID=A0AAN7X535_ELEMC|nr:hypothetical protein PBY51_004666 [Eleginops maclovinus]